MLGTPLCLEEHRYAGYLLGGVRSFRLIVMLDKWLVTCYTESGGSIHIHSQRETPLVPMQDQSPVPGLGSASSLPLPCHMALAAPDPAVCPCTVGVCVCRGGEGGGATGWQLDVISLDRVCLTRQTFAAHLISTPRAAIRSWSAPRGDHTSDC